jgi:ubiquinone/menaquinone biosynthesis C-methylase UbiE
LNAACANWLIQDENGFREMIAWIAGGAFTLLLLSLLVYWQLAIAEGAYLGRYVVTLLYDWFAPRYDRVKQFQPATDTILLAMPIMRYLDRREANNKSRLPEVLDVATGTGRLPQTLLAQDHFHGHIVALDLSARMLAQGQAKLSAYPKRVTWMLHDAQRLPFENDRFDVVTCLESLEFFPRPLEAVCEMARVLKPGGLLMISNRIGPDAWKLPNRTMPTAIFVSWLSQTGLHEIEANRWLIDYDLIRTIK